jgi:hypothetical protein
VRADEVIKLNFPAENFCVWPRALPRSRPVRIIVGFPPGGASEATGVRANESANEWEA